MNQFVPRQKLGKKAKRALDKSHRVIWDGISPVTRRVESKKTYKRKKSLDRYDEYGGDFFAA